MTLDVRLFAAFRQRLGRSTLRVELDDQASVADLRRVVSERHPELADLAARSMVAVDSEYADDSRIIPPGSEVALIPPVSGG